MAARGDNSKPRPGGVVDMEPFRRAVSGCADVMIARGAVADPFLALRIRGVLDEVPSPEDWLSLQAHLAEYWRQIVGRVSSRHAPGRLKLLLSYLRRTWPQADALYGAVRPLRDVAAISALLGVGLYE